MVEGAVVAGEEADAIPPTLPRKAAYFANLRFHDEDEARSLHNVGCNGAVAVCPHAAHDARLFIVRAEHHVINNECVMSVCEQIGEPHVGEVPRIIPTEIDWPFTEDIIRHTHPSW